MNGGIAMCSFEEYKNKLLQNPEFKKEWDVLEPEFTAIREAIKLKKFTT